MDSDIVAPKNKKPKMDELSHINHTTNITTSQYNEENDLNNINDQDTNDCSAHGQEPVILPPRRIRRAETVLRNRTQRISVVLPDLDDDFSQQAIIRTAESLGIQYAYTLVSLNKKSLSKNITRGSSSWITLQAISDALELYNECVQNGGELWYISSNMLPNILQLSSDDCMTYKEYLANPDIIHLNNTKSTTTSDRKDNNNNTDDDDNNNNGDHTIMRVPLPLVPELFASHTILQPPLSPMPSSSLSSAVADDDDGTTPHPLHHPLLDQYRIQLLSYLSHRIPFPMTCCIDSIKERFNKSSPSPVVAPPLSSSNTDTSISLQPPLNTQPPLHFPPSPTSLLGFPPRVYLIFDTSDNPILQLVAHKHIYIPSLGLNEHTFTQTILAAVILDRCLTLCPESIGDISSDKQDTIRRQWFTKLLTGKNAHTMDYLCDTPQLIPILDELRINALMKCNFKHNNDIKE